MMPTARADPAETLLLRQARLATLAPGQTGLGVIDKGAVVIENGRILYVGPEDDVSVGRACRWWIAAGGGSHLA